MNLCDGGRWKEKFSSSVAGDETEGEEDVKKTPALYSPEPGDKVQLSHDKKKKTL